MIEEWRQYAEYFKKLEAVRKRSEWLRLTPDQRSYLEKKFGVSPSYFPFSVLDVETTGLFPQNHDRIIEVAVITLASNDYRVISEYSTLINPERDVGPTYIHGISAGEVKNAPTFGEVAGDLLEVLAGTVVIGHNVNFDLRFLEAEFGRLEKPIPPVPQVSTLTLSTRIEPRPRRKRLCDVCQHLGIPHDNLHSALDDARATTEVFKHLANLVERVEPSPATTPRDQGVAIRIAPKNTILSSRLRNFVTNWPLSRS